MHESNPATVHTIHTLLNTFTEGAIITIKKAVAIINCSHGEE